jgi:hypothetical protein
VDAELASLVVRGRDDAAPLRVPADDERLRPQVGVLQLLHGGEESVQVKVPDDHETKPRDRA